jgi:RNA polymerase sigma factor (sigma-70 family)
MLDKDLAGLDDRALLDIVRLSPQASQRRAAACELLVSRHQGLVRSCVRPYLGSTEPAEDLMQVGYVGLLKAISNFDPAAGASLATYARPCIGGELKRHFRDKRWQVRVNRPVQELVLQVREATWRLAQELGRTPAESDMARHLGVSGNDLRQARRAELTFWPYSLDAPLAGQPGVFILADVLGAEDPRIEQMHVSRLRTHALGYLRSRLTDPEEHPAAADGPPVAPQPPKDHEPAQTITCRSPWDQER